MIIMKMILPSKFSPLLVFCSLVILSSAVSNKDALEKILVPGNSDTESNREKIREIIENVSSIATFPEVIELPWSSNSTEEELGINLGAENNSTEVTMPEINKEVIDYLFQGDILLNEAQANAIAEELSQNETRSKRQAVTNPVLLWTSLPYIPYQIDNSIGLLARLFIEAGLNFWQQNTCINFIQDQSAFNRLLFTSASGCYSFVGRQADAESQVISIGPGCANLGIVTHEIEHALGFYHTQSRFDRDNYVTINTPNIQNGQQIQFEKFSQQVAQTLNLPYDYGSNMHYGSYDFASDPRFYTIFANDARYQNTLGQRVAPAFSDVRAVNKLYNCPVRCPSSPNCQNCGFVNSRLCNSCICPPYFGGATCNALKQGTAPTCNGQVLQATILPKTFNGTVGSSNSGSVEDCIWHIQAPQGTRIQLALFDFPASACLESCPLQSLEINVGKFDISGMKVCCASVLRPIYSDSNFMAIRGLVRNSQQLNFRFRYTAIPQIVPPSLARCNANF